MNKTVGLAANFQRAPVGFPVRLFGDYIRLWRKADFLRKSSWDIYHFHGFNIGSAVMRLSRALSSTRSILWRMLDTVPRLKRVLTVHGLSSELVRDNFIDRVERELLSRFDHVICVDRHLVATVREIAEDHSFDLDPIYVPNSVDTHTFSYHPHGEHVNLRVGFVGRAEMSRGIRLLSDFATCLPGTIDLHLALLGNKRDMSQIPKHVWRSARSVDVNLTQKQMVDFYREIDVLFNPVLAEGISRATLEAMATGRPPIMLARGNRYPVVDGRTGFLINSADELLRLLSELTTDRERLHTISQHGRKIVEGEFDCQVVLPTLNKVYSHIQGSA